MDIVLQPLLIAASGGLAAFCVVLARRLQRLNDLENGLGGAIAVMVAEVDRLEHAIRKAREEAASASDSLAGQIELARKERALWDLHQTMDKAVGLGSRSNAHGPRRLRKRLPEAADA
ncbi:hypothetical protein A7A09_019785 [Paracoccus methylarcula]|uniref:Uncharacterized protein n=2 Tax=Paracoccus methylarcula TaxID=72022 RepID=A0A422QSX2_9RHOB|nr:hypothetical protein A7A09_019785 [Paracoccus methylarcula]